MQKLQAKQVAGYVLLPGFIPRLRELFSSGFDHLAFLVASVYGMVRLLPPTHPYLNPVNIGKFGVRHAIAAAANNIVLRKENIDQILVFSATVVAFVLLVIQFCMLVFTLIVQKAFAADFMGFFITANPEQDIAFQILARVFGVPDLFCNATACVNINDQLPWPFHTALFGLYQYYSLAILLLAVIIFLYYVMVVTVETAQSGTPFGKRFNQVWAPLRLVAAVGLLVPVNWGLNSGQYITLYAAKYGSGLATHGWLLFNRALRDSMTRPQPIGEPTENLVALPNAPDVSSLLSYMILVQSCRAGYEKMYFYNEGGILGGGIEPWLIKLGGGASGVNIIPASVGFDTAVNFYEGGDVLIRFGRYDTDRYKDDKGNAFAFCGELSVKIHDANQQPGAWPMQRRYYDLILAMWNDPELMAYGQRMTEIYALNQDRDPCAANLGVGDNADCERPPLAQWRQNMINTYQAILETYVREAWQDLRDNGDFEIPMDLVERGWGGAGIWYNRIAQFNGAFMSAVRDVPSPTLYPSVLQNVLDERRKQDQNIAGFRGLCPNQSDGQKFKPTNDERDSHMALLMCETIDQQLKEDINQATSDSANTSNVAWKMMSMLFDAYGLSDLRKPENQHVHPLAQLVAIGKSIIDSTIRNLTISFFAAAGGGMSEFMGNDMGAAMQALSKMFFSLAMIGLVAGFILYYVLPFLPFIYFFFAVGSWVKTIFEAMVGVPLWALAHLRIDGEGLPGHQAAEGYFLIFEIFLRPILCVFGLLAGIAIFAAQARVLNAIFDLVIENLTGFNDIGTVGGTNPLFGSVDTTRIGPFMPASDALSFKRQVVDQFFFTIIYAVLLYMMAVASFKLIDLVPKGILRWIGSGARTFQDIREDPTAGLTQYAAMGGYTIGQQVADTARQGFGLAGGIVDKLSGPGAERSLQAARSGEVSPSSATPGGMAGATAGGPTAPAGTPPATPTAAPPAPAPAPAPPAPPPAPAPRAAPPAPPAPPTGRGPTGGGGRGGSGGGSGRGSP